MLGSLADTGLDLVASLVTLYGVRVAAQPADHDHRFGHGKAEALAALFQVGAHRRLGRRRSCWRAIDRLIAAATTAEAEYGIGVSVIAIAATLALLAYQRRVIARTGSVAIGADHVHYQIGPAAQRRGDRALVLDQYAGLHRRGSAVRHRHRRCGSRAARGARRSQAIDQLMDSEWPEEKRRALPRGRRRHPELKGIHDLRTRTSGARDFVQFHVWVDPEMTDRRGAPRDGRGRGASCAANSPASRF